MKRHEINNLIPKIEQIYNNLEDNKNRILKEQQGKSGVYLLTNTITFDICVGSSVNLGRRFKEYLTLSHISKPVRKNTIIHRALIKYGYSNFQLEIIEYCNPDNCIKLEQKYLDLLQPTYNILKKAGSSKGYKHTLETLETKMRPFLIKHNAKKRLPVELLDLEKKRKIFL